MKMTIAELNAAAQACEALAAGEVGEGDAEGLTLADLDNAAYKLRTEIKRRRGKEKDAMIEVIVRQMAAGRVRSQLAFKNDRLDLKFAKLCEALSAYTPRLRHTVFAVDTHDVSFDTIATVLSNAGFHVVSS